MNALQSGSPVAIFDQLLVEAAEALALPTTLRERMKSEIDAIRRSKAEAVLREQTVKDLKYAHSTGKWCPRNTTRVDPRSGRRG